MRARARGCDVSCPIVYGLLWTTRTRTPFALRATPRANRSKASRATARSGGLRPEGFTLLIVENPYQFVKPEFSMKST